MKIMILVNELGKSAPGIVFEKLISGLSSKNELFVYTAKYEPRIKLNNVKKIHVLRKLLIHDRIKKASIILFGKCFSDWLWVQKLRRTLKRDVESFDLVLSLISLHNYNALFAGVYFSQVAKLKLIVYCVDAIPSPNGWMDKGVYYRSIQKLFTKNSRYVDAFFSSNDDMLRFQKSISNFHGKCHTGVIYTPGLSCPLILPASNIKNFLYCGGIYGLRKIEYVLEAFGETLKQHPDATLTFVGSNLNDCKNLPAKIKSNIAVVDYTDDLIPYYLNSIALLDIDADVDDDIYLSSKIANYIFINRLIISETGNNSPSRKIFKGIPSIIQCSHDVKELTSAMNYALTNDCAVNLDDRRSVLELFSVFKNGEILEEVFDKLS